MPQLAPGSATGERLRELLDRALASPLGIKVMCSDADILRRRIYAFRKAEVRYRDLILRVSPHEKQELWILKGEESEAAKAKIEQESELI